MSDTIEFRNPERVVVTGFNGWVSPSLRTGIFCARCEHFDLLKDGHLEGIAEDLWVDECGNGDWTDIRKWAAGEYGWVHMVHNEDSDTLEFTGATELQRPTLRKLARESGVRKVIWKHPADGADGDPWYEEERY